LSRIINGGRTKTHIIKPYKFKNIEDESEFNKKEIDYDKEVNEIKHQEKIKVRENRDDNSEVIKNLLAKIEELSNNIVTIQHNFEKQIQEYKSNMEIEKQKAFEEGYKKGIEEAKKNCEAEFEEKKRLLEESISKIDKINEIFEEKILSIEKELISVALDIAKEVIQKEISKESSEIAYNLAKSLMEDIKEATKIKIKVNPKDAEYLKGKFENVEIIPDSAVKEGGVVIISDLGNIDGEIMERFKNIKEAIEGRE